MEYDRDKYKAWTLRHPLILHWILNPGLAVNELVLGQRIPKLTLIDETSSAPFMERQYVPCLDCGALNNGRIWSGRNAFGHWFGYVCPECGGRIPCLWNLTSIVLLAVTFPVWIWVKLLAERRWIETEQRRAREYAARGLPEAKSTAWLKSGLLFGALMFCAVGLPWSFRGELSLTLVLAQFSIWMLAGLGFGLLMRFIMGRPATRHRSSAHQ